MDDSTAPNIIFGLRFDRTGLTARLPCYDESATVASSAHSTSPSSSLSNQIVPTATTTTPRIETLPPWLIRPIKGASNARNICHSWKTHMPGHYTIPGTVMNEEVHMVVRLRGFGRNQADVTPVSGYRVIRTAKGGFEWEMQCTASLQSAF